jgi:hypothetical protein
LYRKRKNYTFFPLILLGIVLVVTVGLAFLARKIRQDKIANPGEYSTQDQIPRVTVAEANQAAQNGVAVIVDTRAASQFNLQHISGAINIPLDEVEARINELDPDTWYLTYCT